MSFPGGSAGKESTCNAGDLGLIPGLGRSPGEGSGYPLQWASMLAQRIKNPPAMQEIRVQSLDWEDPLEKGMATYWRIQLTEEPGYSPWGHKESGMTSQVTHLVQYSGLENSRDCIVRGVTKSQTPLSDFEKLI